MNKEFPQLVPILVESMTELKAVYALLAGSQSAKEPTEYVPIIETLEKATETSKKTKASKKVNPEPEPEKVIEPEIQEVEVPEDDEFAAFREAAEEAMSKPTRKWTDADLGALCNQAATKLKNPEPIREIVRQFVDAGQVPHSRNVPEDVREAFACEIEKLAGITFAAD